MKSVLTGLNQRFILYFSKILNKAAANTYKALESLEKKGAVLVEEGITNKQYSAISIDEYLDQMEISFKDNRKYLERNLSNLGVLTSTDKIFKLQTPEQVYHRARKMFAKADSMILVDAYPTPLKKMKPYLEEAAANGTTIYVNAYESIEIKGCHVMVKQGARKALEVWLSDWFNVFVDGKDFIISAIEKNESGVQHAIWGNGPHMTLLLHGGLVYEILFSALTNKLRENGQGEMVSKLLTEEYKALTTMNLAGYLQLLQRYGRKGRV